MILLLLSPHILVILQHISHFTSHFISHLYLTSSVTYFSLISYFICLLPDPFFGSQWNNSGLINDRNLWYEQCQALRIRTSVDLETLEPCPPLSQESRESLLHMAKDAANTEFRYPYASLCQHWKTLSSYESGRSCCMRVGWKGNRPGLRPQRDEHDIRYRGP